MIVNFNPGFSVFAMTMCTFLVAEQTTTRRLQKFLGDNFSLKSGSACAIIETLLQQVLDSKTRTENVIFVKPSAELSSPKN